MHGLHLTEPGSDLWRERLAFRDAVRADPALATEYTDLKVQLATEHVLKSRDTRLASVRSSHGCEQALD